MKVVTIGVYGFGKDEFFEALKASEVTMFCDIRKRRGMRGSTYSFVNAVALQDSLAKVGIAYRHLTDLAPPDAVRTIQKAADLKAGMSKRSREGLSPEFVAAYEGACLSRFDGPSFVTSLAPTEVAALFCVERDPQACHRSLVARRLEGLGIPVTNLAP